DLSPGGTVVEASLLMTDLEGFALLAERLADPDRLSQILIEYFSLTTKHILEKDGAIINMVGDAVFGAWGTLAPDPKHPHKAALAALKLHEASRMAVDGRPLRTRVGLHTGLVLAGNIGSAERFDYCVVGDAVNFTSRLEGLNKHLGTNILISDAFHGAIGEEFWTRCMGKFRVAGRQESVVIHELLGTAQKADSAAWLETFKKGLAAFQKGDLEQAELRMHETVTARGGNDGPAKFYLGEIAALREGGLPPDWTGIVSFSGK
ncbi:MAG: adenylate/guanylate cyclase domain-containing protein, partial [Verrucomicrobiota bacterium]